MSKPDDYLRHEALDRTFMIATMIDDFLRHHDFFNDPLNHNLYKTITKCSDMLHETYQEIGKQHL